MKKQKTNIVDHTSSNKKPEGLLLVSLGSHTFDHKFFEKINTLAKNQSLYAVNICLLDLPETYNLRYIYGLSDRDIQSQVKECTIRIKSLIECFSLLKTHVTLYSQLPDDNNRLKTLHSWINETVSNNTSLKNAIANQCYRNLTPILRRFGVRNCRDEVIEKLAPYLIDESAARLWYYESQNIEVEYLAGTPDEILSMILKISGNYPHEKLPKIPKYTQIEMPYVDNVFEARAISFQYEDKKEGDGTFRLHNCSIKLFSGQISGLFGPSGSGKSTLLHIISGHLKPSLGKIYFNDRDITEIPAGLRNIITLFQGDCLFPHLTIRKNIEYGLVHKTHLSDFRRKELADCFLERLELQGVQNHFPGSVSGGEKQRTAIARALIIQPKVLLLDEISASLDHLKVENLIQLLQTVLTGSQMPAVFLVSHDRNLLISLCSHLSIIDKGNIIASGNTSALLNNPGSIEVARLLGSHGWAVGRINNNIFSAGQSSSVFEIPLTKSMPNSSKGTKALLIPPKALSIATDKNNKKPQMTFTVRNDRYHGGRHRLQLGLDGINSNLLALWIEIDNTEKSKKCRVGSKLDLNVDPNLCLMVNCNSNDK